MNWYNIMLNVSGESRDINIEAETVKHAISFIEEEMTDQDYEILAVINADCMNIHDDQDGVLTAVEAAQEWGLEASTVKKACQQGRFTPEEARKTGKVWLVTRAGMERVYGEKNWAKDLKEKGDKIMKTKIELIIDVPHWENAEDFDKNIIREILADGIYISEKEIISIKEVTEE